MARSRKSPIEGERALFLRSRQDGGDHGARGWRDRGARQLAKSDKGGFALRLRLSSLPGATDRPPRNDDHRNPGRFPPLSLKCSGGMTAEGRRRRGEGAIISYLLSRNELRAPQDARELLSERHFELVAFLFLELGLRVYRRFDVGFWGSWLE